VLLVAGLAVLLGALVAAVMFLAYLVAVALLGPGRLPLVFGVAVVGATAGGAAVIAVLLLARRWPTAALVLAGTMFVGTRSLVALTLDGRLASDWIAYHWLAIGWSLGAPPIADRPMGYPILLGEAYRLAGVGPAAGEALNLLAAIGGASLLAGWVGLIAGRGAAAVAVALLAVAPGQALWVAILGTETVYATTLVAVALLMTIAIRLATGPGVGASVLVAAACGALLGASVYLRSTSLALAPLLVALPFVILRRRRAAAIALPVALCVGIALVPAFVFNKTYLDRWSPSTSLFNGWQLYVGLNVDQLGRITKSDVRRVEGALRAHLTTVAGSAPEGPRPRVPPRYATGDFDTEVLRLAALRDDIAFRLAIERLQRDWLRLPLVMPLKFAGTWGLADSSISEIKTQNALRSAAAILGQVWWVVALAGAAVALMRPARRLLAPGVLVSALIVSMALPLLFLQAGARYHEYVVPLVAGLAGVSLAGARPGRVAALPVTAM